MMWVFILSLATVSGQRQDFDELFIEDYSTDMELHQGGPTTRPIESERSGNDLFYQKRYNEMILQPWYNPTALGNTSMILQEVVNAIWTKAWTRME